MFHQFRSTAHVIVMRHWMFPHRMDGLYLRTQTTWEIPEGSDCGVGGKRKVGTTSLPIGIQRPTPLCFRNDAFSSVSSEKGDPGLRRNMIGVLVLGWLYIFSAEMVERGSQENSTLVYTDSRAELTTSDEVHDAIDIGDVDEDAVRWRSAIASSNPGWKAIIRHDGKNVFISPWSVAMDGEQKLKIRRENNTNTAVPSSTPPSSRRALQFLIDFCAFYDIQSQLLAALAVAIILPTHNSYVRPATLPSLTAVKHIRLPMIENLDANVLSKQIPYYMAFSCNFQVVISSLCSIFWEPSVSCNLVSPWLHPVLNEVCVALSSSSPSCNEILCIMCALRHPNLAPLWLGATLSGLAPFVVELVREGRPLVPCSSAWTGCPQSFIDIPGSGPYAKYTASGTEITRADAWRLLYLPPVIDDGLYYNRQLLKFSNQGPNTRELSSSSTDISPLVLASQRWLLNR